MRERGRAKGNRFQQLPGEYRKGGNEHGEGVCSRWDVRRRVAEMTLMQDTAVPTEACRSLWSRDAALRDMRDLTLVRSGHKELQSKVSHVGHCTRRDDCPSRIAGACAHDSMLSSETV
jgi:hypothetical protein